MGNENWRNRIATTILEHQTFDLTLDEGGWSTISHLIALEMLSNCTDADRHYRLDYYVGKVKRNLNSALYLLRERDIPVYRISSDGSKAIDVLTIDPEYKRAKEKEYLRIRRYVKKAVDSQMRQLASVRPDLLPSAERLSLDVNKRLPEETS